jgi:probable F420-dependent oxidoreductase
MKIGLCIPNYGKATSSKGLDEIAKISEKLYDHVWTTDHLLIPEKFSSPYGKSFESLITLAYLVSKTQNVGLGTSIIIFPMREVVLFAKQTASLQILSNGRLLLGLGAGWNETEFQNLRADFKARGQYYDEGIQLLRWLMKGNSQFKGDYYSISDGVFLPVPKKQIPLIFGGNAGPSLRRAAKFGDGWHPVGLSPLEIEKGKRRLRELTGKKMRIVLRISVNFKERQIKERENAERSSLSGNQSEILSQIAEYENAGVTDLVCYFGDLDLAEIAASAKKFGEQIVPSI